MNTCDVVDAAIRYVIPASRLMLFARLTTHGATRSELAAVLASYRPAVVILEDSAVTRKLSASDEGITMSDNPSDPVGGVSVSWSDLAGHLGSVLTPPRAEQVWNTYRASLRYNPDAVDHLADLRPQLAGDAATAARPQQSTLTATDRGPRLVYDGTNRETGFAGTVRLSTADDAVFCLVNWSIVLGLQPSPWPNTVNVNVREGDGTLDAWPVRHVPVDEQDPVLPATFEERVTIEILDEDATGARWAIQVDGYDTAIIEAGNELRPKVRVAVYDNNPNEPFLRHESSQELGSGASPAVEQARERLGDHAPRSQSVGVGRAV